MAPIAEIDPTALYRLLQLRVDVFVVEQECAYPELDGRDLEPGALQLWIEEDGQPLATLRLLRDDDRTCRIGRVATAAGARSRGLARDLIQRAITECGDADIVLDAQAHLAGWYARFGFERDGVEYVEDNIPHVPMRRRAPASG